MAERAPLLPEVTSDVASVLALRHVEADEDGQRDASRARTRGRVRAAIAATGLMALVGAAATRASRPDAGGFFAPSSFSGARLGARRAPRDADADASARPARLTDRIGASDAQHPNSPQQPRAHFRAPTATIDGIDETRWRPEEMPVTRKPRGAPNEWGSARDELPWWAQPGAANAIAFPDSHEAKTLDRHLAGEGRVQGERERERHADTARLGDKVNESMLQLTPEEAAERSERVAARRRRRQHNREIRDARAQAETASRADPYDAGAETKTCASLGVSSGNSNGADSEAFAFVSETSSPTVETSCPPRPFHSGRNRRLNPGIHVFGSIGSIPRTANSFSASASSMASVRFSKAHSRRPPSRGRHTTSGDCHTWPVGSIAERATQTLMKRYAYLPLSGMESSVQPSFGRCGVFGFVHESGSRCMRVAK